MWCSATLIMTNFKYTQPSEFVDQMDAYSGGLPRMEVGKKLPSPSAPAGKGDCADVHFPFGRNGPQH